jgi:hypothetical protein
VCVVVHIVIVYNSWSQGGPRLKFEALLGCGMAYEVYISKKKELKVHIFNNSESMGKLTDC